MPLFGMEPRRGHRAADHGRDAARPGRAGHCLDAIVGLITPRAVGLELAHRRGVGTWSGAPSCVFTGERRRRTTSPRAGSPQQTPNYFAIGGGLMAAMIMGLTTLVGFDSAANLAEEAKDPVSQRPARDRGDRWSPPGCWDCLFLIALTVAIKDVPRVSASGSPVAAIIRDQLGPVDGTNPVGRDRVCVVRRRDGGDGGVLAAGVRDGARRTLPRARA